MKNPSDHEQLLNSFYNTQKVIFKNSSQAIYVFLDDINKKCNKNFASLLGYKSETDWANIKGNFIEAFVSEKSQGILVDTYQSALEKMTGSQIEVTWKKKSGGTVDTLVILIPIIHENHVFALHFVSKVRS